MQIDYLACGKCNEFLRVVAPEKDFTQEIAEHGGDIDGVVIFQCPNAVTDLDSGHTRVIVNLAEVIKTGKVIE